ncbi:hypothetical protein HYE67_010909 [Fusarium culmorum]|uniref:Uncharacterized protein n=1 Tax=Fusarium culmorum TaxID=5516 RepID=A0A2T4GGM0_FUSCU|nr:hypothetical protein FCULG_00009575 [Fusarium culmorum]QPC68678.1 hypothetical protein HYE67_010909 [Fusarium culmorum]
MHNKLVQPGPVTGQGQAITSLLSWGAYLMHTQKKPVPGDVHKWMYHAGCSPMQDFSTETGEMLSIGSCGRGMQEAGLGKDLTWTDEGGP